MYEPRLRREVQDGDRFLKAYNRLRPMFVLVLKILFHLELNSAMSSFVGGSP